MILFNSKMIDADNINLHGIKIGVNNGYDIDLIFNRHNMAILRNDRICYYGNIEKGLSRTQFSRVLAIHTKDILNSFRLYSYYLMFDNDDEFISKFN